jgi:hypothetical protein
VGVDVLSCKEGNATGGLVVVGLALNRNDVADIIGVSVGITGARVSPGTRVQIDAGSKISSGYDSGQKKPQADRKNTNGKLMMIRDNILFPHGLSQELGSTPRLLARSRHNKYPKGISGRRARTVSEETYLS